jgi:putative hydrolase of the HAD superfamily
MLNDIYPAKLVGFKAALFAGDSRSLRLRRDDSRCKKLEADLVITDLSQLAAHV